MISSTDLHYCLLENKIGLFSKTIKIASTKYFSPYIGKFESKYAITVGDKTYFDCKTIQCQNHMQSESQIQKHGRYRYVVTIRYKYSRQNRK